MTGSGQPRREARYYRLRPGAGWLAAAVLVPLLLAVIGWADAYRDTGVVEVTAPVVSPSASLTPQPAPNATSAPSPTPPRPLGTFSIVRSGAGFTIGGQMPSASEKDGLVQALSMAMPGGAIVDQLTVDPAVRAPDIAALGGVFGVIPEIEGFTLRCDGTTVTLSGTAPRSQVRAAAESAAAAAWPKLKIVNDIRGG